MSDYNTKNLYIISKNISKYQSNIYNKNKINYMIKQKKNLIHRYDTCCNKLLKYNLYLVSKKNIDSETYQRFMNKINKIEGLAAIITKSLNKIEEEEKVIMRLFNISSSSIINNLKNIFKKNI